MPVAVPRAPERPPRRARYLIPLGTPRRSEVLAATAVAAVLATALFVPLTLLLFVAFRGISTVSRWRPVWLAVPACCGALWVLAIGPGAAVTAFADGTRLAAGLLGRLAANPPTLTSLPGTEARAVAHQFPVALILATAAAAVAWWARWLHTDEWDLPTTRPGLVSFCRQRLNAASVMSGAVLTRDGACLGIDRGTGRPAALSWRDAGGGVLVTGAAPQPVQASGWQLAHAAIRRRKPVIVVDLTGQRELPGMLAAVCAATAAPLQVFGPENSTHYAPSARPVDEDLAALQASPLGRLLGRGPATADRITLNEAVRRRAVVLFSVGRRGCGRAAEVLADLVAADLAGVYASLGRGAVAPDGLCWFTECDGVDPGALDRLTAAWAGLAAVLATTAPAPAARLARHVNAGVFHRLADRDLAAEVAARTGTRLVPVSRVPAGQAEDGGPAGPSVPVGTMPHPAVPAEALCGLADDEFVLVIGHGPVVRVMPRCRAVAGRIPAPAAGQPPGRPDRPAGALTARGRPV